MSEPSKLDILRKKIESIGGLPTLPKVAAEIIARVSNPDSSMKDISKIIHQDPSLAAKILKVANSAFYGLRQEVTTLQLAMVVLGLKKIMNLVASISIFSVFPTRAGRKAIEREKFWLHSAGTGTIARILAQRMELELDGEEFVAGLLHDIGKIVIDQYFHEDFLKILDLIEQGKDALEAENTVLGASHAEIGEWIAFHWRLPRSLIAAIRYHHDPAQAGEHTMFAALAATANQLAIKKGIGFFGES
ncbi:MAG: HDOD domain-containing protein, partial [Planctomycetota bacterium]